MKTFFLIISALLCCCIVRNPAYADWINLSGAENAPNIAEIHINDDHVKVDLEIFVNDMVSFDQLIPDEFFKGSGIERPPLAERMRRFSNKDLQIIADQGQKLQASLKLVEPRLRKERPSSFAGKINPYTRQPIPGPPEDKRVLYAELVYPFMKKPRSLTIIPPLDEKGLSQVPISFVTYHQGVPIHVFRYLSEPSTVTLDWKDPWYSVFDKKLLKRTLQSGVRTYLYIEPYEVRHEILVRVKDMMAWMDCDLRGDEFIEEDEFNRLRKQVGEFFMERENVLIDGKRLKPILDRTAFVESSIFRSRFIETPERVPINTAMIGVIITYLTDGIPQEVTAQWDLFSERVKKVTAQMTDPAGPFPYDMEPGDNVLKWTNYLKNYTIPTVDNISVADRHKGVPVPLGSLVCVLVLIPLGITIRGRLRNAKPVIFQFIVAGLLAVSTIILTPYFHVSLGSDARASQFHEEDGKAVMHSLLKNVYRAFDFRDEEDVYDKLAVSVNGDLLADVYLQHRKSMVVEQAGGARAKVERIEIREVAVSESAAHEGALDLRSVWTALGKVGHWGHIHTRENLYDAIVTIKVVDGFWKIIDLELLEEKRIDPSPKPEVKKATAG